MTNQLQVKNRIAGIILTRLSAALDILTTLPTIKSKAGKTSIIVGFTPINSEKPNTTISNNLINVLADILSSLYLSPVELTLIRINYLFNDSHILANYLALMIGASNQNSFTFKATLIRLVSFIAFNTENITMSSHSHSHSHSGIINELKGIKVRVSGRLSSEPTRPRQTVHEFIIGNFKSGVIEACSYTVTNSKGSITVKV